MPRIKERVQSPKQSQRVYRTTKLRANRIAEAEELLMQYRSEDFIERVKAIRPGLVITDEQVERMRNDLIAEAEEKLRRANASR